MFLLNNNLNIHVHLLLSFCLSLSSLVFCFNFNCYVILIVKCLNAVMEADVEKDMIERKEITLQPTEQSMEDELVSI